VRMGIEDMVGADVETGGVFDPWGFSRDEASLFRRRAVELKHGRIAMLACLGKVQCPLLDHAG
jgi:light-harvesting complex I chlorophyll a/b binding protein 1